MAIGTPGNDGNGNDSGHVSMYNLSVVVLASNTFVQANFFVYPNPVSEILTIQLENNLDLQKIHFYSTLGQLVKTANAIKINI